MSKIAFPKLDDADRAILRIVQKNNQITHAAIGESIGLSTSAVRRRLATLREDGYIAQDVATLRDENAGVNACCRN